ncbi:FIST C-terminal domain-containing protein [Aquabacterium sp. A7-Y]|uniref:FIST N-terminal domain-containing protein n=1 Tax=Aquabacterium sp. A7-Y TaxID=1349605 RepID=UPI00223CCF73|nr:FIST N-terminal domain-containing protein [Aquabacterium sp. A7-Y]MCW7539246.1 FIST C-terminal domain-containing protein [Aquabacterium sp. A7-Y]
MFSAPACNSQPSVLRGMTQEPDPERAAAALYAQIGRPGLALAVVFCSPSYDRERLARALRENFGETPLIGCTTAAEIGPGGYRTGGLSGFSLAADAFSVVLRPIEGLQGYAAADGQLIVDGMRAECAASGRVATRENSFAFLLIDGTSKREERVAHSLHIALGDIELFGGSSGDGVDAGQQPYVMHGGAFHRDLAVLALVSTARPFAVFKTESHVPTSTRMVITEADPENRRVIEINGERAAIEYARLVGVEVGQLDIGVFSRYPVGVMRRGEYYPRAIAWVDEDLGLTFACAIDSGVVLSVARPTDLLESLERRLAAICEQIGPPELLITFDCLFRYHEMLEQGTVQAVGELMDRHGAVGFSTYGEQYNSMHINQTLTGVAIGR